MATSAVLRPAGGISPPRQWTTLYVIYTDAAGTTRALSTARALARGMDVRLVILATEVVPYPLPLDRPPVSKAFTQAAVAHVIAAAEMDIAVTIYLCRDRIETLRRALDPRSLVIIGARKRWWPDRNRLLVRLLERDGHCLIVATGPGKSHGGVAAPAPPAWH